MGAKLRLTVVFAQPARLPDRGLNIVRRSLLLTLGVDNGGGHCPLLLCIMTETYV